MTKVCFQKQFQLSYFSVQQSQRRAFFHTQAAVKLLSPGSVYNNKHVSKVKKHRKWWILTLTLNHKLLKKLLNQMHNVAHLRSFSSLCSFN